MYFFLNKHDAAAGCVIATRQINFIPKHIRGRDKHKHFTPLHLLIYWHAPVYSNVRYFNFTTDSIQTGRRHIKPVLTQHARTSLTFLIQNREGGKKKTKKKKTIIANSPPPTPSSNLQVVLEHILIARLTPRRDFISITSRASTRQPHINSVCPKFVVASDLSRSRPHPPHCQRGKTRSAPHILHRAMSTSALHGALAQDVKM